ncbi:hypothetical protein BT67DRAFT_155149 [Trichocladium antarcticum]|uniref:Uncharacterized protein n=1 Tax=Trichocladium antarcticum TaxID=1450529 RepID=A0AAN6ZA25_9PEZI|nr:hypothetical protein BT67DRAFT_155149 [Trichocladium antarcticum]
MLTSSGRIPPSSVRVNSIPLHSAHSAAQPPSSAFARLSGNRTDMTILAPSVQLLLEQRCTRHWHANVRQESPDLRALRPQSHPNPQRTRAAPDQPPSPRTSGHSDPQGAASQFSMDRMGRFGCRVQWKRDIDATASRVPEIGLSGCPGSIGLEAPNPSWLALPVPRRTGEGRPMSLVPSGVGIPD